MHIARVIGNVVATIKNETLEGRKILIVQNLTDDLKPQGKPMVALDAIGAGVGELVFWCRGKEASFPLNETRRRPTARLSELLIQIRTFLRRFSREKSQNTEKNYFVIFAPFCGK